MNLKTLLNQGVGLALGVAITAAALTASASVTANSPQTAAGRADAVVVQDVAASPPVVHFTARILDPATGLPKPNGSYNMAFNLYPVSSGGAPLWTEVKSVTVANGVFSTLLGDTNPLTLGIFNGQDLFLGITVGADPEASPRHRIAHTAYAIHAETAKVAAAANTANTATTANSANTANSATTAATAENANKLGGNPPSAYALTGHTHDGSTIAANSIASGHIVDNTVGDADIRDTVRTMSFPANALNYDKTSTILTQYATGIRWQANFSSPAYLMLKRPPDWDGVSDVNMNLHFQTTTSTAGLVQFFIRPRAFNPGETFVDASSLRGTAVSVNANSQIQQQTIPIPASRFGAKNLWVITIQRQGQDETYTGDVILYAVDLTYTAVR